METTGTPYLRSRRTADHETHKIDHKVVGNLLWLVSEIHRIVVRVMLPLVGLAQSKELRPAPVLGDWLRMEVNGERFVNLIGEHGWRLVRR